MKVSILGNSLTSLSLAKSLVNQGIKVDIFSNKKKRKYNKNQTIGMGSLGLLENEMDEEEFINWVQNKLNIDMIRHSKKTGKKIAEQSWR